MALESGNIPDDSWSASIVPIIKKGDKHQASNSQPVLLTSISCKLLEYVIHSQEMDLFDRHSILSNSQHGFRSTRSCETQLAITIDTIARTLDERRSSGHSVAWLCQNIRQSPPPDVATHATVLWCTEQHPPLERGIPSQQTAASHSR